MTRKLLFYILSVVIGVLGLQSCIEDGFSGSSADQPVFSTDTLNLGTIFTEQVSTTHRFTVYNPAKKSINIDRIGLSGANAELFRLNVDGFSGRDFSNVEIRANDSIFVFVETTLPANQRDVPVVVEASLDFVTAGVNRSVVVTAQGRDVERLYGRTISADTRFTAGRPYQIFDSLVVAPGARLDIEAGAELFFHDGAMMIVRGTLNAAGEAGHEVEFKGDRTGFVAADIPFDIMSRQWTGVFFTSTSRANSLSHTLICNTWQGVTVDGADAPGQVSLRLHNSRLRNSGHMVLEAYHADITATGCEFAEAADGLVMLQGGKHYFNHCTLANNYLFTAIGGPALQLAHLNADDDDESGLPYTSATFTNSIFYGLGKELSHSDLADTDIHIQRCLLKSEGTDDENFVDCLWGVDPLYRTVREDYYFDYRLQPESPAIGAADPALVAPEAAVDRYGLPRGSAPDLGAYTFRSEELRIKN